MNRVLTVPNLLTLLRLLSLPVVIWLMRLGHSWAALAVFVAGMATDVFDGWIAVRFNQRSTLGLYLDPVVDKIVILGLFYELSLRGLVHAAVPHLLLARELLQNGVRSFTASRGKVTGANWMGKTKAFLQTVLIAWGLCIPGLSGELKQALLYGFRIGAAGVLVLAWAFFCVFVYWNRRHFTGGEALAGT